jgi:hypothetical protein
MPWIPLLAQPIDFKGNMENLCPSQKTTEGIRFDRIRQKYQNSAKSLTGRVELLEPILTTTLIGL